MLPNTGCGGVDAAGELKENTESEEALVDDPNITDVVLLALEDEDAPNANPVEDDAELKMGDLGVCQVEPNPVDIELVVEPTVLASEEVEVSPKVAPELNNLFILFGELNKELPEEKVGLAVNPKGNDVDELN